MLAVGMLRRSFKMLVATATLLALASFVAWVASIGNSLSLTEFAASGRVFALGDGWVYVSHHSQPDAQTRAMQKRVDELGHQAMNGRVLATRVDFTSTGSGDRLILIGWNTEIERRTVGRYSAEFDRRVVYWISPWLGVIPALILFLAIIPRRVWRNRVYYKRIRNNQCTACGYDMRGSDDRCPECGRAVSVDSYAIRLVTGSNDQPADEHQDHARGEERPVPNR